MARLYNLARMTVTAGGTGVISLGSPVTGYLSFNDAGVTNGLTISYAINDPNGGGSEVGTAVYTAVGTTLTRTVTTSTNANNPINVSLSAQVAIAPAAAELNLLYGFATSTTDNAVSRFNGTTGGTQNSGVIIDDSNNITATQVDAGAGAGPILDLYRDSSSPAAADQIGTVNYNGRDSAGNKELYARLLGVIQDATSTTEDGSIFCQAIVAGVFTTIWSTQGANFDVSANAIVHGAATVTGDITGAQINGTSVGGTWVASQAEQEAATATDRIVTSGRQQFHPGSAKWWLKSVVSGGVPAQTVSYNVTSITDTATGRLTVTIGTDFSSSEWVCLVGCQTSSGTIRFTFVNGASAAAGSVELGCVSTVPALADPDAWHACGFGDQ
jgi:hypothetical protein